jgi:LacI family transcriptional regulator
VVSDVAAGVRLAQDHLRGVGHQRVAYVGGPASSWSDARRRAALDAGSGGRQAVAREVVAREVVALGAYAPTVGGGMAAADAVVASGATAVITFNDVVAVGLIRAVRERGVRVPQDLSVVGCDDTFLAPLVTPALTSIGWDLRELGRNAAEVLAGLLQSADGAATTLTLPGVLTVRDSTAPAPGEGPPSRPVRG